MKAMSPTRLLSALLTGLLITAATTACRRSASSVSPTGSTGSDTLIPGNFITTSGRFTHTEGMTRHLLDVTQSGTSLSLQYRSTEKLPSGGTTGSMMQGSTSVSSPTDPWFVCVESPERFWYFEGKSELSILRTFDASSGRVISAGKKTHPESANVPPAVVLRLPEDMKKLLPPVEPHVKRPGL